jgi:hypothetical protein
MGGKLQAVKIGHKENFDDYIRIKQGSLMIYVHS